MKKVVPLMFIFMLVAGCGQRGTASRGRVDKDPKVAAAEDKIAKTTPEGKEIISKIQSIKPEVNEQISMKTIAEHVDDYSKNKSAYNITPIGWEASQKKTGRWKVVFHYQDYQKQLLAAEWEYNPDENKLYPFEKVNAVQFYTALGADQQGNKSKK